MVMVMCLRLWLIIVYDNNHNHIITVNFPFFSHLFSIVIAYHITSQHSICTFKLSSLITLTFNTAFPHFYYYYFLLRFSSNCNLKPFDWISHKMWNELSSVEMGITHTHTHTYWESLFMLQPSKNPPIAHSIVILITQIRSGLMPWPSTLESINHIWI